MHTSAMVSTAPIGQQPGAGRQGMSKTCRVTPQLSPSAPAAPIVPASRPSALYSSASVIVSNRVLAPRVRRIADLVHALELGHRDGPDEDEHAAEERNPADDRNAKHRVVDDLLNAADDLAAVDGRDVRIPGDEIVLKPRAGRRIVRTLHEADERMRRTRKGARVEDEHEPAAARVAPFDVTDAGHPREHLAAEDVEAHVVADMDVEALVNALLDRHFGRGAADLSSALPERPLRRSARLIRGDRDR